MVWRLHVSRLHPAPLWRHLKRMPLSTAVKLGGVVVALVVTCLPLFFWPTDEAQTAATDRPQTVITVPPVAVVPGVVSAGVTTTSLAPTGTGTTGEPVVDVTIAAVGDIIIHDSVLKSAYNPQKRSYDFTGIFAPVAPYLSVADYTICNLESRMAGGAISGGDPMRFNAPYSLTDALRLAGIDLAATAGNHATDFGWLGIVRTLDQLDRAGIAHVGTYRSLGAKNTPRIVDIKGIKVAFLNYTDFVNDLGAIAGREAYAVNLLDVDKVAEEAKAAREAGADVVVAVLHYGMEYRRTPTSEQVKVTEGSTGAEGLLSRGVDVILGAHPHVVQRIVKVVQYSDFEANDTYAAYSLGNFLTGQRWRYTDSGVIVYLHIQKQGEKTRVTGVEYLPVYVQKSSGETQTYRILPVLPGVTPATDTAMTLDEQTRLNQVWAELTDLLYRPDEGIVPVDPRSLGLSGDRLAAAESRPASARRCRGRGPGPHLRW